MSSRTESSMTSEELLDRSSSWTLACDNALLSRLKKFSENLTSNSKDVLKECDSLSRSITQLDYRLINVSNEFLMLSNTQFVENRVEEFEEFSPSVKASNVSTNSKSKAEKEAALLSKMRQAIQLGLTACTERRHRNDSSVNRFKMNEPYVIGSPKFFSSKYCGLVDESRQRVPSYYDSNFMDSVSISNVNDELYETRHEPTVTQVKPEVKFTMPPTPVFPATMPNGENILTTEEESIDKNRYMRPVVPPSPTASDRSSEIGAGSTSTISRENAMPRAVTDELNKIYSSFAPPPTADDDSDDDFQPSAGVGRIFDDDYDDIFGEKELFPPSQKKTDFFGSSNPSQLPTPVFSVPPPINPVLQSKTTASDVQTLVGPKPKMNDTPSLNCVTDDNTKNEFANDTIREPPPEAIDPIRPKLPPGAVSMFGSLPPPVFNNGTLQAAQTANIDAPFLTSKPDTQISSRSSTEVGSGLAPTVNRDNITHHPSHTRANVQNYDPSQPSHNVTAPGRTENISQGSLSGFGDIRSKPKTQSVPVSSLFADDSSDEDIFRSNTKQEIIRPQKVVQSHESPINSKSSPTSKALPIVVKPNKQIEKTAAVKKSIFDDSDSGDDLFSSRPIVPRQDKKVAITNENAVTHTTKKTAPSVKNIKGASLFGDDSDSDTDLFGNKKVQVKRSSPIKATSKMEDIAVEKIWPEDSVLKEGVQQVRECNPVKSSVQNNNNNENTEESVSDKLVLQSSSSDSVESNPTAVIEHQPKGKESALKKSIFDESDSDDDLFSSKHSSSVTSARSDSNPSLNQTRKFPPAIAPVKGKQSSLFEDDSDSDSELFGSKLKKNATGESLSLTQDEELSKSKSIDEDEGKNVIGCSKTLEKSDEIDATIVSVESAKDISNVCVENRHEDDSKNSKILGSKISEKIKAMQTSSESSKSDNVDFKAKSSIQKVKSKVSVKSLALNLNINPLALKVGAKPPKGSGSTPSTPDIDQSDQSSIHDASVKATTIDALLNSSITRKIETTSESSDIGKNEAYSEQVEVERKTLDVTEQSGLGVNELVGILKARVKVSKKRRPPSRVFLKSMAINIEKEDNQQQEIQNTEKEVDDDDDDNKEKETEKVESDIIKDTEDNIDDAIEESE